MSDLPLIVDLFVIFCAVLYFIWATMYLLIPSLKSRKRLKDEQKKMDELEDWVKNRISITEEQK